MKSKVVVSLDGKDARGATPEECAFHSDFNTPKIEKRNFFVFKYTFASNPVNQTITLLSQAHGYKYIPLGLVFIEDTSGVVSASKQFAVPSKYMIFRTASNISGVGTEQYIKYYMDATNVVITYTHNHFGTPDSNAPDLTGKIFTFKVYIFVEEGA